MNALLILNSNSSKPIYVQIAEWIETEILSDALQADQKVYSQYQLSDMLNINPATAGKGLSLLVDEEVLYKKRGLGMFVSEKAKNIIMMRRKNETLGELIGNLVKEAAYLNVTEAELIRLIREEMGRGNEE
ncbi:GntR family transcriptional regulator [Rossellomorea marisflavi]|nr:GntR family transcriptional regulator [Rossellomorea marisflavi]